MNGVVRSLQAPSCLNPIKSLGDDARSEEPYPPFFGFAPAETPVRIVRCPECKRAVSAAHLHLHQASHATKQATTVKTKETFHMQTDSKLVPQTACPYAERHTTAFRMLFDRDQK
jgi:hypothetical protein